jgi:hypothetical protein
MQKTFALFFGSAIAIVLILLYATTIIYMIIVVIGVEYSNPDSLKTIDISSGLIFVNTTVSGLVAALVISELAITKTGDMPATRMLEEGASDRRRFITKLIVFCYILVWILTGLAALCFGVILYPQVSSTLSDAGTTWLGLAVAAGYSYFGIQPQS